MLPACTAEKLAAMRERIFELFDLVNGVRNQQQLFQLKNSVFLIDYSLRALNFMKHSILANMKRRGYSKKRLNGFRSNQRKNALQRLVLSSST